MTIPFLPTQDGATKANHLCLSGIGAAEGTATAAAAASTTEAGRWRFKWYFLR